MGVGTGVATAGTSGGATCTLGEVSLFAQHGAYLPTSYMIAKGQTLTISLWTSLFTVLGTTYGGNGSSTFKLPKLQSLAPDHMTYAICVFGVFP
jgi:microcystin-dependent protein